MKDINRIQKVICLLLFASLIVFIQLSNDMWLSLWCLLLIPCYVFFSKRNRGSIATTVAFGIGFYFYLSIVGNFNPDVIINRLLIVVILMPLIIVSFFYKSTLILYWKKPAWENPIYFPWIWSGFHRIELKLFLTIAIIINTAILLPLYFMQPFNIGPILITMLLFAFINATLEELLWRGVLLSRFSEQMGTKWAVIITSLGFGLQHYSLGYPWLVCLLFGFGGFFYAIVTIISKSIIPALIWHFVLNLLMVLSGVITF